jgi:enterochelin esterase-like enzyme
MVPPYCGVPRLSHQLPVLVVVAGAVTAEDVVVAAAVDVVTTVDVVATAVVVVVEAAAVVEVVEEVDELQDATNIVITRTKVAINQIILLFINCSF